MSTLQSTYTGLYIQKDTDGKIHTVQVIDIARNSIPFDAEVYIERNIKPDIKDLPTQEEYDNKNSKL